MLCWSPSRVANGHPPHGRVHRAPRPLRPPAQGPLLWLPCGVEARSGDPAASRHATTSPGAVSAPDHHGAEQVDETRGGVDLHGVAPRRPRQTTRPHAPLRSLALRNLQSQLLELSRLPCCCLAVALLLPSRCHAVAMMLPCCCHAVATQLPCCCHAVAMALPCNCHAVAMRLPCTRPCILPCGCHAVAMMLTCSAMPLPMYV